MNYQGRFYLTVALLLLLTFALVSCGRDETPAEPIEVTRIVTVEVPGETQTIEVTRVVEVMPEVPEPAVANVPFEDLWLASAHADASAEAFVHWNEDDPAEIPERCAKCHSTIGYQDFLGVDGSEFGVVNAPAAIGTVIECEACHNDVTRQMTSVVFPSGIEITGLGAEARCMQCHQGRASTQTVDDSIANVGLAEEPDTVSPELGFTNIHYYAAAATQYGTQVKGGYEYAGKAYDARFEHVAPYQACVDCHDPHSLEVKFDECTACHTGLNSTEDLVNIRMPGSLVDYDGDGDMEEGVYFEIEDMRAMLYQSMLAYASEVSGTAIGYSSAAYPYFFIDTNADGEIASDEAAFPNRYNAWTPRLARAAYNYQVSLKDPGRYAHGGKYIIQLLYDSIEDLNAGLAAPVVDVSTLRRIDHGHFASSEYAFRRWDGDGVVSASCSKCHTATGLPFFLKEGVNVSQPSSSGLNCATCHSDVETFALYEVQEVTFPSGLRVTAGEQDLPSNLCLSCHQGRESTTSVNRLIGNQEPDTVSESLRFLNIHYFAAGATLFGTEAKGAYEYDGETYVGRNQHVGAFNTCTECHSTHALEVKVAECGDCHEGVATAEDLRNIRHEDNQIDYDGDGDATEGIAGEIETMRDMLYAAIQEYAANTVGTPVIYNAAQHPYYFIDTDGDGAVSAGESASDNRYVTWTPRLLRAAYNYQYAKKDPGGFAHNGLYLVQVLYDSLSDMGVDVSGMTRPAVP